MANLSLKSHLVTGMSSDIERSRLSAVAIYLATV
jgi:hypothetical protein